MKAQLEANTAPSAPKYPFLGIHKDMEFVVLFLDEDNGVIVWSILESHKIGELAGWDESEFIPYTGKVILSND